MTYVLVGDHRIAAQARNSGRVPYAHAFSSRLRSARHNATAGRRQGPGRGSLPQICAQIHEIGGHAVDQRVQVHRARTLPAHVLADGCSWSAPLRKMKNRRSITRRRSTRMDRRATEMPEQRRRWDRPARREPTSTRRLTVLRGASPGLSIGVFAVMTGDGSGASAASP